jgi:3-oxoacyl-[acyl-carrier-protein] synthase II
VLSPLPTRVFITGVGIVSPLGLDWAANERSLRAERTAFSPVDLFDVSRCVAKTAGLVELPTESLLRRKGKRREALLARGSRLLIIALREALAQAGLVDMDGTDAMVIGTSAGAMALGEDYARREFEGRRTGQLARVDYYQPQGQMRLINEDFDWQGPVSIISNACASGANAVGRGLEMIRSGRAERVVVGGYDALSELVFVGFDSLKALAPSGIPRPFDAARDGLAVGEGASVMVLESEQSAIKRGAGAIAELSGYATATDLHHLTQPDPAGGAAIRTMTAACRMAQLLPVQIDYINSHGTGTPYNDAAESAAIAAWAGADVGKVAVSSTKSAMGHLLGGAGAVEAAICVMALRGQWLPASLGVRELDPCVSFDLVREFRPSAVRAALTNSFGFGGTNATVVMQSLDHA